MISERTSSFLGWGYNGKDEVVSPTYGKSVA